MIAGTPSTRPGSVISSKNEPPIPTVGVTVPGSIDAAPGPVCGGTPIVSADPIGPAPTTEIDGLADAVEGSVAVGTGWLDGGRVAVAMGNVGVGNGGNVGVGGGGSVGVGNGGRVGIGGRVGTIVGSGGGVGSLGVATGRLGSATGRDGRSGSAAVTGRTSSRNAATTVTPMAKRPERPVTRRGSLASTGLLRFDPSRAWAHRGRARCHRRTADQLRIELGPRGRTELVERLLDRQRLAVRARRRHRRERVADGEDPGDERDVLPGELVEVARPVPSLVVVAHAGPHELDLGQVADDQVAQRDVLLDDLVLVRRESPRLAQDVVGDADLADVV